MAKSGSVNFNADITGAAYLSGFLQEVSLKIGTPMHIGPVLKYVHATYSQEFTAWMETIAGANPDSFHHVYEWNMIGVPQGKLWKDVLKGGGNVRTATFQWKASKSVVPVSDEAKEKGVKQIHVFTWKAPVMEYGEDITISPKRGKGLAYFTGPVYTEPGRYSPVRFTTHDITVHNPGGSSVKGAFTREYINWWGSVNGGAHSTFESRVRRVLEKNTEQIMDAGLTKGTRNRTRTFGLSTIEASSAGVSAALTAGKAAATAALRNTSANYIEQARARERIIYND